MLVMIPPGRETPFRRSVHAVSKDRKTGKLVYGNVLRVLQFKPGAPVDLTGDDLEAVRRDLGHALVEVRLDAKGRPRLVDRDDEDPKSTPAAEPKHDPALAEA